MTPDENGVTQAGEGIVSQYLDATWRLSARDFAPLRDFADLPAGAAVQENSNSWANKFFRPEANPYNSLLRVHRSVHHATPETFDVLRHEYEAQGKRLTVDETVNFFLITLQAPLDGFFSRDEREKQNEINESAALLLNMTGKMIGQNLQETTYTWVFQFPPQLRDGARFSTDFGQHPLRMWSWASRVDGGIHQNRLYFLCFKQREQTSGKIITPDGQHWFDGKAWDAFK